MLRMIVLPIFLLAAIVCCMGQTFQYSRGWTNGKRSNFRSNFREESALPDIIDMDTEKKLDKCLLNLQRIIHNPYILHTSLLNSGNPNNNKYSPTNGHHQSNDMLDDIVNPETIDFIKSQT